MRKRMFLTLVLSLCMANFGAFAANSRGNARGSAAANNAPSATASSTVSARAATRNTAAVAPKTNTAPVSAHVAVRNTPKVSQPTTMAARAASTQKVINNGTKVATAASNTVIDQECQNAFYGCMDSFCMIDNASGGRCQCSNRNAELLSVMDDIAKLDEQSYLMATEGVERIQMGESADQIIARAKAAGDQAVGKTSTTSNAANNQKKVRTLDLSAWNTNIFSEDEDIFDDVDISVDASAVSNALSKTGDALYTDAAKMCIAQMPAKCNASVKMLQSVYAQKIKSDCIAFENSLKQQKIASTQKLQAAEKALRDAALDEFKDKNKYNLGGCVQEYARCMQNECGDDYSKCITLSAQENMMGGAGEVKDRTIKGVVDIVLSGSTMNQLLSKKTICDDEVLVHCENYRAQVWDKYIIGAATELKVAELAAEDNMRQNCIKTTAECFRNSCAAQWDPKSDATNYDICLADPMMVYDSCKIKIEPCLVATGSNNTKTKEGLKNSRLWSGVISILASLRVDACTEELKAEVEKNCGEDFSNCIGLSSGGIVNLVAEAKLTACQDRYDDQQYLEYIEKIAQGYKLQLDSSVADACQKAVDAAMVAKCGSTEACETATLSNQAIKNLLKVQVCSKSGTCHDNLELFGDGIKDLGLQVKIVGPKMDTIKYNYELTTKTIRKFGQNGKSEYKFFELPKEPDAMTKEAAGLLNTSLQMKLAEIKNDSKVDKCVNGNKAVDSSIDTKTFSNLTKNAEITIADSLLSNFWKVYDEELTAFAKDKIPELSKQIAEKVAKEISDAKAKAEAEEASKDATAESLCKAYEGFSEAEPSVHGCIKTYRTYAATYNSNQNQCVVVRTKHGRTGCNCGIACPFDPKKSTTKTWNFSSQQLIEGTAKLDGDDD